MKKVVSFILLVSLLFVLSPSAKATAEIQDNYKNSIETSIEALKASIPDAEIRIVNNTLHIVVNDLSDIPWLTPSVQREQSRITSVINENGGSFRNFVIPWYGYSSYMPYSQVYMNRSIVDALKLMLLEPTLKDWVISRLHEGLTEAAIASLANTIFGISISAAVVATIISLAYFALENVEYYSLLNAQNNSSTGKVCVLRGMTPDGIASCIYSPWNNNTCTTYLGYDATWHSEVYDI